MQSIDKAIVHINIVMASIAERSEASTAYSTFKYSKEECKDSFHWTVESLLEEYSVVS